MPNLPWGILLPAVWWLLAGLVAAVTLGAGMRRKAQAGQAITNAEKRTLAGVFALAAAPVPSLIQYAATGEAYWAGLGLATVGAILVVSGLIRGPAKPAPEHRPPRYSFREKSAAITLIAILLVYGWATLVLLRTPAVPAVAVGALIATTIFMIIIMTASHIALALVHAPEKVDERDRTVTLRSNSAGYWTLAIGIWGVIVLALAGAPPAILAYAAMGAFVLSEIARLASELLHYRYFWFEE